MSAIADLQINSDQDFCIKNNSYDPQQQPCWESLLTMCNGNFGLRGSLELQSPGQKPGLYIAGLYDKPDKDQRKNAFGLNILNKSLTPALAVCPLFYKIRIIFDNIDFDFFSCKVIDFNQTLDMLKGLRFHRYILENKNGLQVEVNTLLCAHKKDLHLAVQMADIKPLNFSGKGVVQFIDHQQTRPEHLDRIRDYVCQTDLLENRDLDQCSFMHSRVLETGYDIFLASSVKGPGQKSILPSAESIVQSFEVSFKEGSLLQFCKYVSVFTTLDKIKDGKECINHLRENLKSEPLQLLDGHFDYWQKRWDIAKVCINGDQDVNLGLRWCQFHLTQLGNEQNPNVSIPATGLHGPGYFGHIFWDTEIYMLPFFLITNPIVARNLLMYRYNRLDAARTNAKQAGLDGAKFPWVSTDTGLDVTPPDWESSGREIHINGAVAYAFHNYRKWTDDEDFYRQYGIEVIAETAKFWASRSEKGSDGKYHLLNIVGPDEYNVHANDNYYTNHLAVWNMRQAIKDMQSLQQKDPAKYDELKEKINWSKQVVEKIKTVADSMYFPPIENNVCEQFEGFFKLPDLPELKRDQYGRPLSDRGHKYDGSSQMSKQPDVVMMHYLFGDDFPLEVQKACFEYYDKRCVQGSSLSPSVSCIVGLDLDMPQRSYNYFRLSALLNLHNLHTDKTLSHGIHVACAGGTCKAAILGYGGVSIKNGILHIEPVLPAQWSSFSYSFLYCQRKISVTVQDNLLEITLTGQDIEACVCSRKIMLSSQNKFSLDLNSVQL